MFNWMRSIMNSGSVAGYFFQIIPITILVGIIYVVIRIADVKKNKQKIKWSNEIMKLLFSCYLTGLVSLIILPANFWLNFFDGIFLGWWDEMIPFFSFGGFNLVPSAIKALSGELVIGNWVKTMLVGNIGMFLPLGFFLSFVTERVDRKNIFAVSAVIPLIVELLQMILGRCFDVDDLICNFIGIVLGFFVAYIIKESKMSKGKNPALSK